MAARPTRSGSRSRVQGEASPIGGAPSPAEPAPAVSPVRPVRIVVCVATCQRPSLLRALLESLARLSFRQRARPEVLVAVVDNDAEGSAREVVAEQEASFPFPLMYEVEPERNISRARNRAVELALRHDPDFLAFVDDDEVVQPSWLDELLSAQREFAADVVCGPALPGYVEGVPQWVISGGFFDPPAYSSGKRLARSNTNNALVAASLFREPESRFDPDFGLSGSSDTHFFLRASRGGARMVWTEGATVREWIPLARANAGWILRRAFRTGNGGMFAERALATHPLQLAPRVLIALGRIVQGTLLLLPSLLLGRGAVVWALWKVCYGAGCLAAFFGYRYYEYRVILRD